MLLNTLRKKFLVFSGRANRKEFLLWHIWAFVILCAVFIFLSIFVIGLGSVFDYNNVVLGMLVFALVLLLSLLLGISHFAVMVRRLHDINLTGWLVLIIFLPFFGCIFWVVLFFWKGDQNVNKYGEPPK